MWKIAQKMVTAARPIIFCFVGSAECVRGVRGDRITESAPLNRIFVYTYLKFDIGARVGLLYGLCSAGLAYLVVLASV